MPANPWIRKQRPLAIAHRGNSISFPENTIVAYRSAIELGVDMIECDVNISSDGQLVMIHDTTLDRTTNGSGLVDEMTWENLQRLDAGGKFGQEFADIRIPSTEETLLLHKKAGIFGCFEVKGTNADEANRIAVELVDLIVKHDMLDTIFISSYQHAALHAAKSRCPQVLLAPERLPDNAPADPPEALRQAQLFHALVLQHQYTVLTPDVVRLLHEQDIAVWSWTTNDEASMLLSIKCGSDGLMSDNVQLMIDVLQG